MTAIITGKSSVRVLIVEDHALFAESLELALSLEGYDVRRPPSGDQTVTAPQLMQFVLRWRPRVVLLDLDLAGLGDGARLINPIAQSGANVVVVTSSEDEARWGECIRNGARKTLSKTGPLSDIFSTVRRITQGLPVLDRAERERLLQVWLRERGHQRLAREHLDRLTRREAQVLGHLMSGRPVREIAQLDIVSEATVRTQVKSVLAKLEVTSQLAAVGLAFELGWHPEMHV